MGNNSIDIVDFNLFFEAMKAAAKLVEAAKLMISPNGLEIYGARDNAARCELTTNAIRSDDTFDLCIENINMFNRVLSTVKDVHEGDYSELKVSYDKPNVMFKSPKFKMKYSTSIEAIISKWISKKVEAKMNTIFEFKTSSDLIKRMNGHAFLFPDSKAVNVFIETRDDMEKNSVFATLKNSGNALGKEITMKFGLVTEGSIPEGRNIIIDLERMNLLNAILSDDIKVSLMDKNVLLSQLKINGKNGAFFNMKTYCSLLKG